MSDKLKGKVAVITGASTGIGLATAKLFVNEGAYVFITGRRQTELDSAAKQIGKNVTAVKGDVSNLSDLDNLYNIVKKQKGRIDILFANAGIGGLAPLGSITEEHYDTQFNVNVKGLLFTVQKALPMFTDGGSIILNSSIAGIVGSHDVSVYSASKAAVRSFARCWIIDLKKRKIRVNVISPGPIETPILGNMGRNQEQLDQFKQNVEKNSPLGRMGEPQEVATAALFLASNDSSYITGIELFVDGGLAQI